MHACDAGIICIIWQNLNVIRGGIVMKIFYSKNLTWCLRTQIMSGKNHETLFLQHLFVSGIEITVGKLLWTKGQTLSFSLIWEKCEWRLTLSIGTILSLTLVSSSVFIGLCLSLRAMETQKYWIYLTTLAISEWSTEYSISVRLTKTLWTVVHQASSVHGILQGQRILWVSAISIETLKTKNLKQRLKE